MFRRTHLLFQLRTALPPNAANVLRTVFGAIARLDVDSYREMLDGSRVWDALVSRFNCYFEPPFQLQPIPGIDIHYGRPRRPGTPLLVIASPYCVYPPAHGVARRIHELVERLSENFDMSSTLSKTYAPIFRIVQSALIRTRTFAGVR
jgi:hypothetical protein